MTPAIKARRADVKAFVEATFPDYKGRTFKVKAASQVTLYNLNWDGGSRSQYRTCTLTGQRVGSADKWNAVAPWVNVAEGKTLDIPQGCAVVEHAYFCGKDCGLTIYLNPADLPKQLTAGN